jgi:hypothetical protein
MQSLANALETYVTFDRGLADLGHWVLEDLPQGRAHFIDRDTDSAWAFVLLWALRLSGREQPIEHIRIGPSTYARRENLLAALGEIDERAIEVARDLKLTQFSSRILPSIRSELERAFSEVREHERARIAVARIEELTLLRLEQSIREHWQAGFPRRLFRDVGSIRLLPETGPEDSRFGITATAPKLFFIAESNAMADSPERIGEDLGQALARGEGDVLATALQAVPLTNYRGTLGQRIRRAVRTMGGHGGHRVYCFIPLSWRLGEALTQIGAELHTTSGGNRHWELEDLDLYELLALRDQSLMFVRLPDAISVWQYENNTDHSVSVRVEEIGPDTTDDAQGDADPRVRLMAHERWRLRLKRSHVKRILIPGELGD